MSKKLLLIINPVSGMRKANRYLTDMIATLSAEGYECTVQATTPTCGAKDIVMAYGANKELIVCIGGDGTLNETVAGCINAGINPEIGYIPAGSTNDFANGLGLATNPLVGLDNILNGEVHELDVGTFNERPFVYTASFGAFTKASYSAPREMRNNLGYMAYVLEGAREIADIQSYDLCITADDSVHTGEYIFGGICNSKRIGGGVIQFSDEEVDMSDGKLEVFLVKTPQTPGEFMQLIFDLNAGNYNSPFIEFFSASSIRVATTDAMDWTLDGEYQPGCNEVNIQVLPKTMKLRY